MENEPLTIPMLERILRDKLLDGIDVKITTKRGFADLVESINIYFYGGDEIIVSGENIKIRFVTGDDQTGIETTEVQL